MMSVRTTSHPSGVFAVRGRASLGNVSLAALMTVALFPAWQDVSAEPIILTHVPDVHDVAGLRTQMFQEGYLEYAVNPFSGRYGHEWTGWNDARSPSLAGPRDVAAGYDRSDRWLQIRTTILTDNGRDDAGNVRAAQVAPAARVADFDFADKAYMLQAGVMPIETATRAVTSPAFGAAGTFNFPLTFGYATQAGLPREEQAIMRDNNAVAPLIDAYYASSLRSGALGETFYPSLNPPPAPAPPAPNGRDDGIFMGNIVAGSTPPRNVGDDAFGHELFHFATDGSAIHREIAGNTSHSGDAKNILFPTVSQPTLQQVGPTLSASVGGKMEMTTPQVERMFAATPFAPYFPANQRNDFPQNGNRVDWDFVTDHGMFTQTTPGEPFTDLNGDGMYTPGEPFSDFGEDGIAGTNDTGEGDGVFTPAGMKTFGVENAANGADRFRGIDSMYWKIGTTVAAPEVGVTGAGIDAAQTGHDHAGMGVFGPEPDFTGSFFRFADVFSLSLRYSDSDVSAGGNLSFREAALDYDIFFIDAFDQLYAGILDTVFVSGWTDNSLADNYLARWRSPVDAVALLISAHQGDGHDYTAQIDAVIVSRAAVPEPSSGLLVLAGMVACGCMTRRMRTT